METPPLLSVVIPCLNRRDYLIQTLSSVLEQDYPHLDCIVADGGSTDGTVKVLAEMAQQYPSCLRWFSGPDKGQGDAINKGWAVARGEILTWLNADDRWLPGAASAAAQFFQDHPEADVVHGNAELIDLSGSVTGMAHVTPWDFGAWLSACDYCITQPASFIRRRILDKVGFLDTSYILIDLELWSRIALSGTIRHLNQTLAQARSHSGYDRSRFGLDQVRITRKTVNNPAFPATYFHLKKRALSRAYLQAAEYERESPRKSRRKLAAYFLHALWEDPTDLLEIARRVKPAVRRMLGLGACGGEQTETAAAKEKS